MFASDGSTPGALVGYRLTHVVTVGLAVTLGALAFVAVIWQAAVQPVRADDGRSAANRQFVEAMRLIQEADRTYEAVREAKLLNRAAVLLDGIIDTFPGTDLAVQLVTNQFVGDFDFFEFKNRVDSLVCYTPDSSACFLQRITALLPPIEVPITSARWDWLSLAVAHHFFGSRTRAREIVAPFLSAVRRGALPPGAERDLFVSRALALTGESEIALGITRGIAECSTRVYNLTDIADVALWEGRTEMARELTDEALEFARTYDCSWEMGLVVQALWMVGRQVEARRLLLGTVETRFPTYRDPRNRCCPPELAVAAADVGDANLALTLLRAVQNEHPWVIAAVLERLSVRGHAALAVPYAEQVQDADVRAEAFALLVGVLDAAGAGELARDLFDRVRALAVEAGDRRPAILAWQAFSEHVLFDDERWRRSFQQAVTAAERGSSFVRRDIGGPLLAVLVHIETGRPMLN